MPKHTAVNIHRASDTVFANRVWEVLAKGPQDVTADSLGPIIPLGGTTTGELPEAPKWLPGIILPN